MAKRVSRKILYHVTRLGLKYSSHPLLEVGSKITAGKESNPFFAYYESSVTLPVKTADGTIQVSVMRYLSAVEAGEIDSSDLPRIARSIASHYLMLSRELIMEETRKQIAPDAPSRHTCLWTLETEKQARYWQHRLAGASKVAVIRAWGVCTAPMQVSCSVTVNPCVIPTGVLVPTGEVRLLIALKRRCCSLVVLKLWACNDSSCTPQYQHLPIALTTGGAINAK